MGLRVRAILVVLLLLAVAALAVPLALSLADRRTANLAAERDRQLAALADSAAGPGVALQHLVDRYFDVYGEGVSLSTQTGECWPGTDSTSPTPASLQRQPTLSSMRRCRNGIRSSPGTGTGACPDCPHFEQGGFCTTGATGSGAGATEVMWTGGV